MVGVKESILELWGDRGQINLSTGTRIRNLSTRDILYTLNTRNTSGVFMMEKDFRTMLSDIR